MENNNVVEYNHQKFRYGSCVTSKDDTLGGISIQ